MIIKNMSEYLQRHLEPIVPMEPDAARKSLEELELSFPSSVTKNFAPEMEFTESGTETVELLEGGSLTFSYETVPSELIEELKESPEHYRPTIIADLEKGRFRRMTSFSITNSQGKSLELAELPLRNLFFTTDSINPDYAVAILEKEDIFSYEPPLTFRSIMTLMHEAGHNQDLRKSTPEERGTIKIASREWQEASFSLNVLPSQHREQRFATVAEVILRAERNAWAAAVLKLRPLLPLFGVSREDLLKSIHETVLADYSESIRDNALLQQGVVKLLGRIAKKLLYSVRSQRRAA